MAKEKVVETKVIDVKKQKLEALACTLASKMTTFWYSLS